MPVSVRVLLFVFSSLSFLFVVRSIKKARVQLYDTTFWIFLSVLFVVLSIFPGLAIGLAELIGIQSPVNLVFLIIIFFLLAHCFLQSLRFSRLEERFNRIVSDEALKNTMESESDDEKK